MKKITKQELIEYVEEVGVMTKEHRRGSNFYANIYHEINAEDVKILAEDGIDSSFLLNHAVNLNGIYDDDYGCDGWDVEIAKIERYEETIPEKIIPAHTVTRTKTTPVKIVFDE